MASECRAEGVNPFGPTRYTAPLTKSEPDRSRACRSSSYALAGSTSSPSTKARYSPRARSTPRLRAPPGPPCSGCSSVNRGSAAALARAISALRSVDASSTMITSRSAKVWAAIESRQSPRSSALLKNATTTLILGLVTKPPGGCPGLQAGEESGAPRSGAENNSGGYGVAAAVFRSDVRSCEGEDGISVPGLPRPGPAAGADPHVRLRPGRVEPHPGRPSCALAPAGKGHLVRGVRQGADRHE